MAKTTKNNSMAWVVIAALVVGLGIGYIIAKVKYTAKIGIISVMVADRDTRLNEMKAKMNRVVMMNGKMMVIQDGDFVTMDHDMTMSDGTKVMTTGYYLKPGSTKEVLMKNGEMMDLSGNVVMMGEKVEGRTF